jgi:putative transposase
MARFARVVHPGLPYHVTHRGNRRAAVFFSDVERQAYLDVLGEYGREYSMDVWGYCLMTNHIHLLVTGQHENSLANAIGRAHMRYARWLSRWHGWSGHLWANRFFSTPLDDHHMRAAIRYIEQNPVRAGLVTRCEDYAWSSTRGNAQLRQDSLLAPGRPFTAMADGWLNWVNVQTDDAETTLLRRNTHTGRPTGSRESAFDLEARLGRILACQKVGRKPRSQETPAEVSDFFEVEG